MGVKVLVGVGVAVLVDVGMAVFVAVAVGPGTREGKVVGYKLIVWCCLNIGGDRLTESILLELFDNPQLFNYDGTHLLVDAIP